ncbi:MAG: beta-galactosidase [Hahellaceae bacterium]|nr:beta-galactosidase [Hahellaceae bacterium]
MPRPVLPGGALTYDFLGINAHFLWFTPLQYQRQMELLRALGLDWVRVDLHWDHLEPHENQFRHQALDEVVDAGHFLMFEDLGRLWALKLGTVLVELSGTESGAARHWRRRSGRLCTSAFSFDDRARL